MEEIARAVARFEDRMDQIAEHFGTIDEDIKVAFEAQLQHIQNQEQSVIEHLRLISRRHVKNLSQKETHCVRLSQLARTILDAKKRINRTHWPFLSTLFDSSIFSASSTQTILPARSFIIRHRLDKLLSMNHKEEIPPHALVHEGLYSINRSISTISSRMGEFSTSKCGHTVAGPWGLAIHPITGNVFVAERLNSCILELDPDLNFVKVHKMMKTTEGEIGFNTPIGVGISSNGMIAVVEYNKHQMRLLDKDFRLIRTVGKHGKGYGDFCYPYFVQFDEEDFMYLSDNSNGCVHKFDQTGKHLFDFAESKSQGSVGVPSGVAVLDNGVIIAMGCGKSNVKCFSPDGQFTKEITLTESTASGSYNHLARGPNDTFILSDKGNNKVCITDMNGTALATFGANGPVGAAFGMNNRLYVAESSGNRISMF